MAILIRHDMQFLCREELTAQPEGPPGEPQRQILEGLVPGVLQDVSGAIWDGCAGHFGVVYWARKPPMCGNFTREGSRPWGLKA